MSRPIRIAYPGAWYHVMNRGRRAEDIYLDKKDYHAFVELLKETSQAWNIRIAAYCLMPNHYHMLVHTPEGNISRAMRHINGVYTQRFNTRHQVDGQLFRGRYKSILVNGDSYLLQLVRYIHRNPLKSGIVENMNAYPWTSHKAYLSVAKKWDWLHKQFILALLTGKKKSQIGTYRRFVSIDDDKEIENVLAGKKWPSLLGPQDFLDWVKATYQDIYGGDEMPQARELYPDADRIIAFVCDHYKVEIGELFTSKRGTFNEPRCAAIFLIRRLRHDKLKDIGNIFNLDKYSSVSSILERMKSRMKHDRKLRNRIQKLETQIRKSQEQT
jgi:REP-associated tyrosine transposase